MRITASLSLTATVLLCATLLYAQVPPSSHVFVVVEENHPYQNVVGNPAMPFFNSLAAQYGLATNYFANVHPSLPNYFMLTTGQLLTTGNADPGIVTVDNIVRELLLAGKTWRSYAQGLPAHAYLGHDSPPYWQHHNPFVFFSDVNDGGPQQSNIVPFDQFATDLLNGQLANYSFIVPDVQHDAHECAAHSNGPGCDDSSRLASADLWLQTNLLPLLQSPIFQPGGDGLLIIVFDESFPEDLQNGGGHVAALIAGPNVVPGTQSSVLHQHQDVLRLCAEALGLPAFPGLSATASDMAEFFAPPGGGASDATPLPTPSPGASTNPRTTRLER